MKIIEIDSTHSAWVDATDMLDSSTFLCLVYPCFLIEENFHFHFLLTFVTSTSLILLFCQFGWFSLLFHGFEKLSQPIFASLHSSRTSFTFFLLTLSRSLCTHPSSFSTLLFRPRKALLDHHPSSRFLESRLLLDSIWVLLPFWTSMDLPSIWSYPKRSIPRSMPSPLILTIFFSKDTPSSILPPDHRPLSSLAPRHTFLVLLASQLVSVIYKHYKKVWRKSNQCTNW